MKYWNGSGYDNDNINVNDAGQIRISLLKDNTVPKIYEPGHEKMCLMSYANNKNADHLRIRAVWSAPLLFAA